MRKHVWVYYLGLYILLILVAMPLLFGWIPPNRWYGFRLPGAQLNPALWYDINHLGAQFLITGLLICGAVNVVLLWRSPKQVLAYLPWINAALILLNFWLVTSELLLHLPG